MQNTQKSIIGMGGVGLTITTVFTIACLQSPLALKIFCGGMLGTIGCTACALWIVQPEKSSKQTVQAIEAIAPPEDEEKPPLRLPTQPQPLTLPTQPFNEPIVEDPWAGEEPIREAIDVLFN